jgi:glutamate racemase
MKIGVFDSGVGGLTVLKALREELPYVDFFYLGDTARVPYGGKSKETIQRYSLECAEFLLSFGIELLVVACNTASAYALELLKEGLAIPVVGVVQPGVEQALKVSKTKRIGVIGTKGHRAKCCISKPFKGTGSTTHSQSLPPLCSLGGGRYNQRQDRPKRSGVLLGRVEG